MKKYVILIPTTDLLDADVLDNFDYSSFQLRTLEDLTRLGVALRDVAGLVFMDLLDEIKKLDIPSMPVLIAVDQYNYWELPSVYSYEMKSVHSRDICVPNRLSFVSTKKSTAQQWELKNGLCVAAVSYKHPESGREKSGKKHKNQVTVAKLGTEATAPSIPLQINVPLYSRVEFLSAMSMYTHSKSVEECADMQDFAAFRMHSGSNPLQTRLQVHPFFFPISVMKQGVDPFSPLNNNPEQQQRSYSSTSTFGGGDSSDDKSDEVTSIVDSVLSSRERGEKK